LLPWTTPEATRLRAAGLCPSRTRLHSDRLDSKNPRTRPTLAGIPNVFDRASERGRSPRSTTEVGGKTTPRKSTLLHRTSYATPETHGRPTLAASVGQARCTARQIRGPG